MDSVMDNEGSIDLCLLGLGHNGHLGLIEPSEQIMPHWHLTDLSSSSLDHSMLQKYKARPSFGITLGMGDLLRSKHILLLVSGSHKKDVLKKMFDKKVSTSFPASFLWLHSNVTILCDREAAVSLEELIPDVPVKENL
jgi:galactosamine-6-phosphate isomerase